MIADLYSAAVRDEIWIDRVLVESRVSFGTATRRGTEIVASDAAPGGPLYEACENEMARVRAILPELERARVRAIVRATTDEPLEATIAISIGGISIVTTPQHALADAAMLRGHIPRRPPLSESRPDLPIVWHNGSAAVLLHEAAGHAAEHGHTPLRWPSWLRVRDNDADLLAGEAPRALRRATFRDVPLPRMSRVLAEQDGAPFALPDRRIDVQLVAGGSYEPLTETVIVEVAIAYVGEEPIAPFEIRAPRASVAASLAGARGEPLRYPGVVCSREGQELFVASRAPVLITVPLP